MILIDTSAWVEFLRATGSHADLAVQREIAGDVATCDPIRMELLAGARNDEHLATLRKLLARATQLPTKTHHYEEAALLYRRARSAGLSVRSLTNCLVAAIAIDYDASLLHHARDFTALAQVSRLR